VARNLSDPSHGIEINGRRGGTAGICGQSGWVWDSACRTEGKQNSKHFGGKVGAPIGGLGAWEGRAAVAIEDG